MHLLIPPISTSPFLHSSNLPRGTLIYKEPYLFIFDDDVIGLRTGCAPCSCVEAR
jgi:hypothetical protein